MRERLRAENLCKSYAEIRALDGVSFAAGEGECVGVFGVSGAGKSVLVRILAREERPDSGTLNVAGPIGFSHQTPFLDGDLTPAEALWLYAALYEIPRGKRRTAVRDALALVGLEPERGRRIRFLSAGGRKLVEIARAILCPSDVLLLDEPMADLDFEIRRRLWEHILKVRAYDGKTVVIATSRADDADLCDRIILLHCGRALAEGTPAELRNLVGPEAMVVRPLDSRRPTQKAMWSGVLETEEDDSIVISVNPESPPLEILRRIPCDPSAIRIARRGLDSVLEELAAKGEGGVER